MGMFDYVIYWHPCPMCGGSVTDFQTKDKNCDLDTYEPYEVDNFYSMCDDVISCNAFINLYHQGNGVYKVEVAEFGDKQSQYDHTIMIYGGVINILEEYE